MNHTTNQFNNGSTRNARFWTFENDSWVKITLRPDQSLSWGRCSRDCEGYSSEGNTWSHEGDRVLLQWTRDGRDCDGRVSSDGELACPLDRLTWITPLRAETPGAEFSAYSADFHDGTAIGKPDWQQVARTRCRDEFAEAAGY